MMIRVFRLAISCVVFCVDYLTRILRGDNAAGTCVVINYHALEETNLGRFVRQLDVLQTLARPISLLSVHVFRQGERYVSVTFDDAFRSFKEWAFPELAQRMIPTIVFVPSGYLGKKSAWLDNGGDNPVGEVVMSVADLRAAVESELVQIGSHSVSHPNLVDLGIQEARSELEQSKKTLEAILGKDVESFSFPYGSVTEREVRLAREVGYKLLFSIAPEQLVSKAKYGLVGRVNVQPTDWLIEFRLKVLGAYRWMPMASAWKRRWKNKVGFGL